MRSLLITLNAHFIQLIRRIMYTKIWVGSAHQSCVFTGFFYIDNKAGNHVFKPLSNILPSPL